MFYLILILLNIFLHSKYKVKIQALFLIWRPQLQNINSGNNLKIPTKEIVMEPTPAIRKPQMGAITSKMLK